jgi:shikimate dehydrogenase
MGIDAIYKPLGCETEEDFKSTLRGLKAIKARGVSVSMPFKILARQLFDTGNVLTSRIGNANTIDLRKNQCFNTDYFGFALSFSIISDGTWHPTFTIVGDGAMSKTIQYHLRSHESYKESNIRVIKREHLSLLNDPTFHKEVKGGNIKYLINASPIGMDGVRDDIFTKENTKDFDYVIDVVNKKETNLKKCAEANDSIFVSGVDIFINQLTKQFEIYTGHKVLFDDVRQILIKNGLY